MFESIIPKKITPLISPLIFIDQHGFLRGKATVTNHLVFRKFILDLYESAFQVDEIYTDFSKTFDKLNHTYLYLNYITLVFEATYYLGSLPTYQIDHKLVGIKMSILIHSIFYQVCLKVRTWLLYYF